MYLSNLNWNEDYKEFIDQLKALKDENYKKRHQKILGVDDKILGISIPKLREIAKLIVKGDYETFLSIEEVSYSEERILKAIVIGLLKLNEDELKEKIELFIPYINSWAVCDVFASGLKRIKKLDKDSLLEYLSPKKNSNNFWEIRFLLTVLLGYYLEDKYIDKVFEICEEIDNQEYYVVMAKAWLIATALVKCRDKTFIYLENTNEGRNVINVAVQKIRDSYRVSKEDKELVLKYKKR